MTISRADAFDRPSRAFHTNEPASTRAGAGGAADAAIARHVDGLSASSAYLAFLTNLPAERTLGAVAPAGPVAPQDPRGAAVRSKLDAVRDAFSGPYVVDGCRVTARPMFRMTTHVVGSAVENEVDALARAAGVGFPAATRVGQGAPGDLVKITQALIQAGRLPPGGGDLAARIRQMQWTYGIGVDCAGYSKQALLACSPHASVRGPGYESFRDLDGARANRYARVSLERSRAGDLVTLDPVKPEVWGHNVVIYSHVTADVAARVVLADRDPNVRSFLASAGPHHIFEVDSSWGAGSGGAAFGGFRRDTWLYDASSKTWGSFDPRTTPARFITSPLGPGGDAYHAAYRPR